MAKNRQSLPQNGASLSLARVNSVASSLVRTSTSKKAAHAIVLYCDLSVDPAREQEMLSHFHHDFKPAAETFEGYIDLKMLKVRTVIQGGPPPPDGVNYRFQLTYENEELRQKWVASDVHKENWALIENTLVDKGYVVLLTDSV